VLEANDEVVGIAHEDHVARGIDRHRRAAIHDRHRIPSAFQGQGIGDVKIAVDGRVVVPGPGEAVGPGAQHDRVGARPGVEGKEGADQEKQGRTDAQIAADLKAYDKWDRYDFDGDGNFNESDGYIDHFQLIHAGGDEADGDPIYGEDAIWSHRWYAFANDFGVTGPAEDFCLVVTQRRHLADTALVVSGDRAQDWLLRAQAFAGPATDGPTPKDS